jgi:hypothetical protein
MTDSLFPDLGPTIEQQIQRIDAEILSLLMGKTGGPLGLSMSDDQKLILRALRYRRGSANAISIRELQTTRGAAMGDRAIKAVMHELRTTFRLPIGSNKGTPGGYYIMISPEDHAILRSQILDQVRAELAVLKATSGPHAARELLGQLRIEIDSQDCKEAA